MNILREPGRPEEGKGYDLPGKSYVFSEKIQILVYSPLLSFCLAKFTVLPFISYYLILTFFNFLVRFFVCLFVFA